VDWIDFHADEGLRSGTCPRKLPLRTDAINQGSNVKRASWRRGAVRSCVRGKNPEGRNPKSVIHLKMVERQWREKAAERLKKPVSGTVIDGVGTIDAIPARRGWEAKVGNCNGRGSPVPDAL